MTSSVCTKGHGVCHFHLMLLQAGFYPPNVFTLSYSPCSIPLSLWPLFLVLVLSLCPFGHCPSHCLLSLSIVYCSLCPYFPIVPLSYCTYPTLSLHYI